MFGIFFLYSVFKVVLKRSSKQAARATSATVTVLPVKNGYLPKVVFNV